MDTMSTGEALDMCDIPDGIDPEALRILREAAFVWDSGMVAFRRGRSTIDYAFLREQRLIVGAAMSRPERIGQLQRMRILIQSMD
jgi:hypothetical protein